MPVLVTDHQSISRYVGGVFDCVTATFTADQFSNYLEDSGKNIDPDTSVIAVAYLNDNGLVDNLPLNKLATIMFARELRGDIVLVGGKDPDGNYDGENHDLPVWFTDCVYHTLKGAVDEVDEQSTLAADAMRRAVREGLLTMNQFKNVVRMMEMVELLPEEVTDVMVRTISALVDYHRARQVGCPKWTKGSILVNDDETLAWDYSDEELDRDDL